MLWTIKKLILIKKIIYFSIFWETWKAWWSNHDYHSIYHGKYCNFTMIMPSIIAIMSRYMAWLSLCFSSWSCYANCMVFIFFQPRGSKSCPCTKFNVIFRQLFTATIALESIRFLDIKFCFGAICFTFYFFSHLRDSLIFGESASFAGGTIKRSDYYFAPCSLKYENKIIHSNRMF